MKVFLAFVLIFSVYVDFSNICAEEKIPISESMELAEHHEHEHAENSPNDCKQKHCHCELGHFHSACHTFSVTSVNSQSCEFLTFYPDVLVSSPQNTHDEIIRPPIFA